MPPSIIDLTEPSSPAPTESEIVPVAVLLEQAMVQADGDRLRRTLLAMCDASPEVVRIVGSLLLIPRKEKVVGGGSKTNAKGYSNVETDQNHKETSESSHTAGLAAKGIKRMRTRYPICSRCDEEFDVTNNKKESCRWHSGEITNKESHDVYDLCLVALG